MDTISGFSGKSYEKIVQKKDPGNRENGVHSARKMIVESGRWMEKVLGTFGDGVNDVVVSQLSHKRDKAKGSDKGSKVVWKWWYG
jgi:hypothetical protein